jgi:alpha-beta hydrolase superfamily lysophospholipase
VLAIAAALLLGWAAWAGGLQATGGIPAGLALAAALPCLRPLRPDAHLLAKAIALDAGDDARAVALRPDAPRATVLVAHGGGNDRAFGLWHLVAHLLDRQISVVLFNHAGHGREGSDRLDLGSFRARFDAVLQAARASERQPIVAVGQSLGGACVLDAVARGAALDGAVTVSAVARLDLRLSVVRELAVLFHRPAWLPLRWATPLELAPAFGAFLRDRFPVRVAPGVGYLQVFAEILRQIDLPERLRHLSRPCPILLLHGASDGIVPVAQGRALAAALGPTAHLRELPGRHHLDPLFDDQVVRLIADFVDGIAVSASAPPARPAP